MHAVISLGPEAEISLSVNEIRKSVHENLNAIPYLGLLLCF